MDQSSAKHASLNGKPERGPDVAESTTNRSTALLEFLLEFGPFGIAAILLVLASLANDVPDIAKLLPNAHVGIYVCAAFVALLAFVVRLTHRQEAVEAATAEVVESTRCALETLRPDIESVAMSQAFQRAGMLGVASDHVRIFAVTSRFVSQQLRGDDLPADRVSLMIAGNTASDTRMPVPRMLEAEVQLAIEYNWASRVKNRHIRSLYVRQYEFFPTEWYVIFDDKVMVLGTYAFDNDAVGCATPLNAVSLVHASGAGRELIRTKSDAFDRLMAAASPRIGSGAFEGEYRLVEGKVARRGADGKWQELPDISQTTPV
jgi:hypothetical protein